ncbi:cysteine-rich secretory protein 2 isoform X2 [Tribolium castaneum]|uniref:cysteine-rich secretory protein 2 isoform X2 n=1 Tax=Tribolium castaneum TaxID=7070 RepID=UPI00077DD216|nr:PREDICTED: cysteine-rich secretory protein 2 isoform X2 [Tribolium castaneum]|eukprot:XP_015836142.1 PREDICTED: cysteine-rich secretory protein 2 isoform X2 [Tribolium castaneum]
MQEPKIVGDKIPLNAIMPNRRKMQRKIVQYHNYFRTKVVPRAANMLRMRWHKGAARAAQKWSRKCFVLTHDNITGRHIENYGACGQNIFIASDKVPWLFAIKTWYLEKDNFTFGSRKNDLMIVGHYTQMVWASTHEVGCGLSKCYLKSSGKTFYNYICNYCPIGNQPGQLGRPYRRGRPCSLCRNNCFARKLCTNSCHVADLWANCKELYKVWPQWLCDTTSVKGQERKKHCRATCTCKNKIHD